MTKTKKKKPLSQKAYVKASGCICPACRKSNVSADHPEIDGSVVWVNVSCQDCDAQWTDVYELTGYSNLEVSDEDED